MRETYSRWFTPRSVRSLPSRRLAVSAPSLFPILIEPLLDDPSRYALPQTSTMFPEDVDYVSRRCDV